MPLHSTPRKGLSVVIVSLMAGLMGTALAAPPAVELVDVYRGGINLADYWISEKYDGVRGYWDGHQLLTRQGNPIAAPDWFTHNWPTSAMDGELWAGYGKFSQASATIRSTSANHAGWHQISYQVFDLPDHPGTFNQRLLAIKQTIAAIDQPWVSAVEQFHVADEKALYQALDKVVAKGGEGLVLHRGDSLYRAGRNAGLFKLKPYEDAEAQVIGIKPGKGRLQGKMGALKVRTPTGRHFYIGTGFSDQQRASPPAIGSWISYRFNGRTVTGLPRFARFLRERPGGPPPEVPPRQNAMPDH